MPFKNSKKCYHHSGQRGNKNWRLRLLENANLKELNELMIGSPRPPSAEKAGFSLDRWIHRRLTKTTFGAIQTESILILKKALTT